MSARLTRIILSLLVRRFVLVAEEIERQHLPGGAADAAEVGGLLAVGAPQLAGQQAED